MRYVSIRQGPERETQGGRVQPASLKAFRLVPNVRPSFSFAWPATGKCEARQVPRGPSARGPSKLRTPCH